MRKIKGLIPGLMAGVVALLLNAGIADAGVATIYPGAGNKQPKTPEWNVKNQEKDQAATNKKNTQSVQKLDKSKKTNATMLEVMLGDGLANAVLSATGDFELVDGNAGKVIYKMSGNSRMELGTGAGYITVNGEKINSSIVTLKPVSTDSRVQYNGTFYRGELRINYNGSTLQILNHISLEDYVKGVLPGEMSPSWQPEALKAQAVAARTFALYSSGKNHNASSGYDLCSSSHCQVYSGSQSETDTTDKAVDDTYGQVMYYNYQPIYAAFHSSSGGATENSENVWGSYLPYLRSVTDDDSRSPYHDWTSKFTVEQLAKRLASSGKGVGTLQTMALIPVSANDGVTGRSASGRPYGLKFTGSEGTVTITGEQARSIFGLKSAMFTVSTQRTASAKSTKKAARSDGSVIAAAPAAMSGTALKLQGVETVIFYGHGFGHGLGMAQYGANAMATAGSKYDAILHYYYTDVVIQEIY